MNLLRKIRAWSAIGRGRAVVFLFLASFAYLLPSFAAGRVEDIQVIQLVQKFISARDKFDVDQLRQLTADNFVEVTPSGDWYGRDKLLAYFSSEHKMPAPDNESSTYNVRFFGETSVVVSQLTYDQKSTDGGTHHIVLRVTYAAQRVAGTWKVISVQYTPVTASN